MPAHLVNGIAHLHRLMLRRQQILGEFACLPAHLRQFVGYTALPVGLVQHDVQENADKEQAASGEQGCLRRQPVDDARRQHGDRAREQQIARKKQQMEEQRHRGAGLVYIRPSECPPSLAIWLMRR